MTLSRVDDDYMIRVVDYMPLPRPAKRKLRDADGSELEFIGVTIGVFE